MTTRSASDLFDDNTSEGAVSVESIISKSPNHYSKNFFKDGDYDYAFSPRFVRPEDIVSGKAKYTFIDSNVELSSYITKD